MRTLTSVFFLLFVFTSSSFAGSFTPGNIVVVRVGDGSAVLSTNATAVFLDEYTPAGVLVQSVPLPTAVNGSNLRLTLSGTASSEGGLNLSGDWSKLTMIGYDASPGEPATNSSGVGNSSNPTPVKRVIGVVNANGDINTITGLTDAYSGNNSTSSNLRSVVTMNGQAFWIAGYGPIASNSGIRYATIGSASSTQLVTSPTNVRSVNIFNNQLYFSAGVNNYTGITTVGTGLPTTNNQTANLLPGFDTYPANGSPYAFSMKPISGNVMYIADDNGIGGSGGGIQKWVLNNGNWSLSYIISVATGVYARGMVVDWTTPVPTIYVTYNNSLVTPSNIVSYLYKIVDNGDNASSTKTLLTTAPSNTAFRGIAFAPNTVLLPVNLLSFTASIYGDQTIFNWKTASEHNSSHFILEQSTDGKNFSMLAKVMASGNSTVEKSYSHSTTLPVNTTYYRLKMVDADGKSTTSNIVKLKPSVSDITIGNVYPIPAKNNITVEWYTKVAGANRIAVTDMSGKIVQTMTVAAGAGFNKRTLDISKLSPGQYFLQIEKNGDKVQTKITRL